MRAVIIPCHQYVPQGITQYYRIYFDFFLRTLEKFKDEFDFLYLVDHAWKFTQSDNAKLTELLGNRYTIKPMEGIHWTHFQSLLPEIQAEKILFLDQDNYIYRSGFVKDTFDSLENFDLVSMFDGSGGGAELRQAVWKRFPSLSPDYIRIAPYYMGFKKNLFTGLDCSPKQYKPGTYIEELNYTTKEDDFADSFGEATFKVLAKEPKILVIDDDRRSLYISEGGEITESGKAESVGCYHIRNWSLGLRFINESKRKDGQESYRNLLRITPFTEAGRLLGWLWVLAEKTNNLSNDLRRDILKVTNDYGLKDDHWLVYTEKVKELHSWLNEF